MDPNETPAWSEEEKQKLHHESFISELLKRRNAESQNDEEQKKGRWQRFVELLGSAGVVALITVTGGGIFGQCISGSIQSSQKEREFQQARLKAEADQALLAYKEYLEREHETVLNAFELIGSCISASEDLIRTTGRRFHEDSYKGAEQESVKKQKTEISSRYDARELEWRSTSWKLGLLMSYYHHADAAVSKDWGDCQERVTQYMDCAAKWNNDHPGNFQDDEKLREIACKEERRMLAESLRSLNVNLEKARKYAWQSFKPGNN